MKPPKKLIEVALPLKAINEACYHEKMPGIGAHPRGIHIWWARRPLAAARAVIFAQMVDDPLEKYGENPTPQQRSAATKERRRLFALIEELVKWENTNNEEVLERARAEIRKSCPEGLPAFHDPFAGGGTLPLEAQRLGLESYASDLNPVAVMINKAMIEIPPKFAGRVPVGPIPEGEVFLATKNAKDTKDAFWPGDTGLAEDVRRYGYWMREEAKKRIGHLYPQVEITKEMAVKRPDLKQYVGQKLTVIAWLWARTVKSPNPMYSHVDVPLVSSFVLSSKKGKEAWVKPVVEGDKWHFEVCVGAPPKGAEDGNKHTVSRSAVSFDCIVSGSPISGDYIKDEGLAGRMGVRMMAVVCEGTKGRVYLSPQDENIEVPEPKWKPTGRLPARRITGGTCVPYGLDEWWKLFTKRQLVALNTFSDLVHEAHEKVFEDCGDTEYANAVATYLGFAVDRIADFNSCLCRWSTSNEKTMNLFARQSIPMTWDFSEANVLGCVVGGIAPTIEYQIECVKKLPITNICGYAAQADAQNQSISRGKLISTDPPYYDNISYADLADFFYMWMRRSLKDIYPELFSTMATPKDEELVATPYKHGGREKAEAFFLDGMTTVMANLANSSNGAFPVTIYYAFKQSDTNDGGTRNAGWETFLEAVMRAGFAITGTWPMRSEQAYRMIGMGANALASSVVLVCRKRAEDAPEITRRAFLRELMEKMPGALEDMQGGDENTAPVAPVDMAQAIIGPGMEIYSKYKAVLNADGSRMSVHDAIIEINRFLDEGDDFDAETQFCRDWFREHQWGEGPSGEADVLARAKGLSVDYVVDAGVLFSKGGKTSLVKWQDYPDDYDPTEDAHRPVWEVCHHLVRIHQRRGTGAAGEFLSMVQGQGEAARQLAYLLYTLCERKGLAEDARVYNELATAWNDIVTSSIENAKPVLKQAVLDL